LIKGAEKTIILAMTNKELNGVIRAALKEDMPEGDITSEAVVPPDSLSKAVILAKESGVLAGLDVARRVFETIDSRINFRKSVEDGREFKAGDVLARLEGPSVSLLKGERTALNFLQRMSGIASLTRKYVRAVKGEKTRILDTRKTTPGLRALEKYAVKMGGGLNHRFSLSDMVLLKDNHLALVGGIREAVCRARKKTGPRVKIEVEVKDFEEAREAVDSGASMIMLDNMTLPAMKRVVRWLKGRVPVEVSGKITLGRVADISALGVDFISVGRLTHSFKSVDISLEFET
jgi:nicotinate-nucleotide pyrophosphorylase (carboxylating)